MIFIKIDIGLICVIILKKLDLICDVTLLRKFFTINFLLRRKRFWYIFIRYTYRCILIYINFDKNHVTILLADPDFCHYIQEIDSICELRRIFMISLSYNT